MTNGSKLPNFVVIGAPKSGTTSLYFYLKQHFDIFLPVRKELHYFSSEFIRETANGPGDAHAVRDLCGTLEEYSNHYEGVSAESAIGDISPSYLYYDFVAPIIKSTLSNPKIIVILRNPIEKAYSQYMHLRRDQREVLSFEDALEAEPSRSASGWSDMWRYVESSLYAARVEKYIEIFGRKNVRVVFFEDLASDAHSVVEEIIDFLSLARVDINTNEVFNRSGSVRSKALSKFFDRPSPIKSFAKTIIPESMRIRMRLKILDVNTKNKVDMSDDARASLRQIFSDDVKRLEILLSRRLPWPDFN